MHYFVLYVFQMKTNLRIRGNSFLTSRFTSPGSRKARRRILFLLALLVVVTILRETGVININYYSSSINLTNTSSWTNNHMKPSGSGFCTPAEGDCIPANKDEVAVYIHAGSGGFFKEFESPCEQLSIDLSNTNRGFFWTPLYKNVHFSASAVCSDGVTIRDTVNGKPVCNIHQFSGIITITGRITVTGFCSYREVKRLITNELVKTVKDVGRQQLRDL
jgi:hypothetical protein